MQISWMESLEKRALLSAGGVDSTFGNAGRVIGNATVQTTGLFQPRVTALMQESDGKIIAVGVYNTTQEGFGNSAGAFVARLSQSGVLDTSFGSMGATKIQFSGLITRAPSMAIDSSGRIIIATSILDVSDLHEFAVARFLASGAIDTHFGVGGMSTAVFSNRSADAQAVDVGADSKIVVAGTELGNSAEIAVARFTANGSLDKSFSVDGLQTLNIEAGVEAATSVKVLSDGRVLLGGYESSGPNTSRFALIRLTATGQLDNTFDSNGIVVVSFGAEDYAESMLVQSDGKIVLAGGSAVPDINDPNAQFFLAVTRLDASGKLDPTFGTAGKVRVADPSPDSSISLSPGPGGDYRIIESRFETRLTSTGKLDKTLNGNGVAALTANNLVQSSAILARPDGSLIVVIPNEDDLMDTVFVVPTLSFLDKNDHPKSSQELRISDLLSGLAVDANGKLVAGSNSEGDYVFYRFQTNGKLDPTFGANGVSVAESTEGFVFSPSFIPLGNGEIIVSSSGYEGTEPDTAADMISRMNQKGTLDKGYSDTLFDETEDGQTTLLPHGFVNASVESNNVNVRISDLIAPDGTSILVDLPFENPDNFNDSANLVVPIGNSGSYVVEGSRRDSQNKMTYFLEKYDSTGQLDRTFGTGGILQGQFALLFAQADGKLLYRAGGGIKRLDADGTPDATFGTSGLAASGYTNFTADSLDRIIAWKVTGSTMAIARFTPDGKPDLTFGTNGVANVKLPVVGQQNLIVAPNDNLILTSLKQTGANVSWFATRLIGGGFADLTNGKLTVSGTTNADKISLSQNGSLINVALNGKQESFARSKVTSIVVNGFGGDDNITIGAS
ncbi:MAG TPA: hypothetical protein VHS31_05790, partial [Tepidisphaeraceae bacterium]|nr:hypothetical protein [Tepidisphaeraceae bacterium]